jgi:hypothetical protein
MLVSFADGLCKEDAVMRIPERLDAWGDAVGDFFLESSAVVANDGVG